ncbi:MAG: secondary thiamine-phosphate synthase enzyme YjbQ [Armatimonadetes bacterium]|nr:secondary thiamine-phosphate synthase enzyme YjbQ [Armatimonadota bacterium]
MSGYNILDVKTSSRSQFIDITGQVRQLVADAGIREGVCYLYVPHTTAAITINENADPTVVQDILNQLEKMVPWQGDYRHTEGNAAAHIKAGLLGASQTIFISNGRLVLGTWQGIFFCEFDGPRQRKVLVKIIAG